MTLYFITDSRFANNNGCYYNLNGSLGDSLWSRYLEHFDKMVVVARVLKNAPENKKAPQTTDPRVSFVEIPYYIGPLQYLKVRSRAYNIISSCIMKGNTYICRIPSTLCNYAIKELKEKKIPYAIEVVGDPKDALSYTATKKIIPAIISRFAARKLRDNAHGAGAALYVTNETLQKRYPVNPRNFSIGVSDVVIDTDMQLEDVKPFPSEGIIKILAVGSLEQMYKSPDIVLKALKIVKQNNVDFHLTWLGDGKYRNAMIKLSQDLSIADSVSFVGNVSKVEVNQYLRKSDVYVQASRTEGLPRALLEALAVGLPCIATNVGGIPELVTKDYMIKTDDFKQLANIICRFVNEPDFVMKAKIENFHKSLEFNLDDLKTKRDSYFEAVKQLYDE